MGFQGLGLASLGFRVRGFWLSVLGFEDGVHGSGFRVTGFGGRGLQVRGFAVRGFEYGVSVFRVSGGSWFSWFGVSGTWFYG